MATVGIVGGLGPESTIDYYRRIIAQYRARTADGSYPPIVITSMDMQRMLGLIDARKFLELTEYLLNEIIRPANADAPLRVFLVGTATATRRSATGLPPHSAKRVRAPPAPRRASAATGGR